ncbi:MULTISPECIES: DUF262 domain-containing protein [Pseudomonadati]|uniref:DUF262 domain-containing HNH endonuclease family protein n=1 Tax=Shewanella aestuarii TaxID=1028752 RepID=A0ABT0KYG9_9GAMM|nr:DUF262 domain-containing protein [Shewanella aestuarii]MCL1116041.1 DUF262 domain-containing HNH endonuclease family protein [Shewanella aestuarii]GGN70109.1 hypothetical protein GCM10009193_04760 [Shewanella aestuarii]
MSQANPVESLSVKAIFDKNTQYIIPIYQRNYAWGAPEIEQLIQDISDAAGLITQSEQSNGSVNVKQTTYYLGSLVVYQRTAQFQQSKVVYETIDGQQRHTTLSILLAYLKHREVLDTDKLEGLVINLTFDSRPKSSRALDDIYTGNTNGESEEPNIHAAFNIIQRFFKTKGLDTGANTQQFLKYLLDNVVILRVVVPPQTDLNHYFEIMNNRGEQLEKHEVLKAKFMASLDSEEERNCFSTIWEACSNMTRYTQMGFQSDLRKAVFGDDWQTMPASFDAIQAKHTSKLQKQDAMTLRDIIANKASSANSYDEAREKQERFGTVIDFSNFLLHVLKLMKTQESVSLDDKKLIDAFISNDFGLRVDAKAFVYELLKQRILFDSYIIKPDQHDEKRKWSLLTLDHSSSSSSFSYINSFGKEQDTTLNEKLMMILAMFHVSNPAMVYKRWLNDALSILNQSTVQKENLIVDGEVYLTELERLSERYFTDITEGKSLAFSEDNSGVLHQGTGVHNFVFNRLDYLLWKRLSDNETFDGIGKINLGKHFDDFQFSFRTSVEHYFPQTDPSGASKMKDVDRFGNLCLISPSSNSKLSNYYPEGKKSFYRENNRAESLKQAIMMSYDKWGPDVIGLENIVKHETLMLEVLSGTKI